MKIFRVWFEGSWDYRIKVESKEELDLQLPRLNKLGWIHEGGFEFSNDYGRKSKAETDLKRLTETATL